MNKFFKWTGIALGALIALLLVAYGYMYSRSTSRFNKEYAVTVQKITIPTNSTSLGAPYRHY